MNVAFRKPMSPEEFLAWEREQDLRWEFDGIRPVAMTGDTSAHNMICGNLIAALLNRLRGNPCRPYSQGMKLRIGAKYRYPDAFVTCVPVANDDDLSADPLLIFEALSKSTERTDRTTKLMEYRTIGTLRRYILLEQDQAMLTTYTRAENGWVVDQLSADDALHLPEIGIDIPVMELYADLVLPKPED